MIYTATDKPKSFVKSLKDFIWLQRKLTPTPNFLPSVTTNTSPYLGKVRVTGFLQRSLKSFTRQSFQWDPWLDTQIEVLHQYVCHRALSDLSGDSTSMGCRCRHVESELSRITRQYLAVPATSASPERLFSSVGLIKSDLWGNLLDRPHLDWRDVG